MFYEPEAYERMVSWKERLAREAPFFKRIFKECGVGSVLDFGCGIGAHVRLFASWGLSATGIDGSREMIRHAQNKGGGRFLVGRRARGRYDAITCLGNTIPHLFGKELEGVVSSFEKSLEGGGLLIVQNLNYDRILAGRERFVALSGEKGHAFLRFYDFGNKFLTFNIVQMRWEGKWAYEVETTRLNPLRRRALGGVLRRAGFGAQTYYGDYGWTPFTRESMNLICVAKRKP